MTAVEIIEMETEESAMQASRGRAIAASALPNEAAGMREALTRVGFSDVVCVFDGLSVLKEARRCVTDLILTDAVLPVLDAASVLKKMYCMPLTVYPIVVIAAAPGTRLLAESAGACVLKSPVCESDLRQCIDGHQPWCRPVPAEKRARAMQALEGMGVPDHCGRDYLIRASEMAWLDARLVSRLTGQLYPAVAEEFGVDRRHVERSMRHAIDAAWRSGEIDAQYKLFGDTIDARRGSPTLGEMIARIADILRWEGKA